MTLSTHYTKDALESIFATAQKAEFMGIISAYREHKIINGKTQPLSEQENYYRHKFLGLMLNERGIACASFCALSRKASSQTSQQKVDSGAGVDSGVESRAGSKVDSRGENQAESAEVDSSPSPSSSPQSDTKYEWYFYLVWSENASDGIEIGKLGRACGNAYYLSSGGVMHGFAPHKRGIRLKPYIGKGRISPQRVINMLHRWFLETDGTELSGICFYQTMQNSSLRRQARGSLARFHNISFLYYALPRFDKQNPRINAEEYLRSDSMITESIENKTLSPFMLRYIFEERGLMFVDKSSSQRLA
ncbi:hypothetical protein [Helicobacter canis]|uniref:hypothetical protein n=1 Tax=Helicobacter canis TaxID=29419 RepID=UPI002941D135|nr:hypothetical protein [Helicobacter canis]